MRRKLCHVLVDQNRSLWLYKPVNYPPQVSARDSAIFAISLRGLLRGLLGLFSDNRPLPANPLRGLCGVLTTHADQSPATDPEIDCEPVHEILCNEVRCLCLRPMMSTAPQNALCPCLSVCLSVSRSLSLTHITSIHACTCSHLPESFPSDDLAGVYFVKVRAVKPIR
jgi:hypothetical protein